MSTLRVNNIESYTPSQPLNINDGIQLSGSTVVNYKSVALGRNTSARNNGVAIGYNTIAGGPSGTGGGPSGDQLYNFAQGFGAKAYGNYSHVEGFYTVTNHPYAPR